MATRVQIPAYTDRWMMGDRYGVVVRVTDAARADYFSKLAAARAEWNALPEGDRKGSSEDNAYDTEGTDTNELYWFEIALRTYEMF